MTDKIVVFVSCGTEAEATHIARELVSRKLAACVNILPPVRSIYRWKDAIEEATEYLLIIKTGGQIFTEVEAAVRTLHSYEVPEIIALPIEEGSAAYLEWLGDSINPAEFK